MDQIEWGPGDKFMEIWSDGPKSCSGHLQIKISTTFYFEKFVGRLNDSNKEYFEPKFTNISEEMGEFRRSISSMGGKLNSLGGG